MNSDTAIGLTLFFWAGNHIETEFQSLCGSDVTRKIKQVDVDGGTCPSAP